MTLDRDADFIIQIGREEDSGLYVDAAYDVLSYSALDHYTDAAMSNIAGIRSGTSGMDSLMAENPDFRLVTRADGNIYCKLTARWISNPVGKGNTNPHRNGYAAAIHKKTPPL